VAVLLVEETGVPKVNSSIKKEFEMIIFIIVKIWKLRQIRHSHDLQKSTYFDLILWCFNATFSYIMATSFSGGRSRREPPTMGKQLVNFITCGCESSAPFL
jgi:hypothetical protein